jgi:hypothetical protein
MDETKFNIDVLTHGDSLFEEETVKEIDILMLAI